MVHFSFSYEADFPISSGITEEQGYRSCFAVILRGENLQHIATLSLFPDHREKGTFIAHLSPGRGKKGLG